MSQDPFGRRSVHLPSLLSPAVDLTRKAIESSRVWREAFEVTRPDALNLAWAAQYPIGALIGFLAGRGFAFGEDERLARDHPEEGRALSALRPAAEEGMRTIPGASSGGPPSWEWLDELERISGVLRTLLARAEAECPTPPVADPPPPIGSGPLGAYYRELWAAEEEFLAGRSPTFYTSGHSFWRTHEGIERLESIDEQYGVAHGTDPRVYSIAAFIAENTAFESEMKRRGLKFPQGEASKYAQGRAKQYATDYEARHFPGFVWDRPDDSIDSISKLWFYIKESLSIIGIHRGKEEVTSISHRAARRRLDIVSSCLLDLPIIWDRPAEYLKDATERQLCRELKEIRNKLAREEAERHSMEDRRAIEASWNIEASPKIGRDVIDQAASPTVPDDLDDKADRIADISTMRAELGLSSDEPATLPHPHWDSENRKFWYGDTLCFKLRADAGRQIPILEAFEKNGWSGSIACPFGNDIEKLDQTIKDIKKHKGCPIKFRRANTRAEWFRKTGGR